MKISSQAKVGILAAVAIIIVILGVNFLKGRNILSRNTNLYTKVPDAQGIVASGAVNLYGVKVGQVDEVIIDPAEPVNKVILKFHVDGDINLPKNSIAQLAGPAISGFGSATLELVPGSGTQMAQGSDTLQGRIKASAFSAIADQVAPVRDKVQHLITSIDTVVSGLNSVLTPATQANLRSSFASVNNSLKQLENFVADLNGPTKARLNGILADANSITSNFKNHNGEISRAIDNFAAMSDTLRALRLKETVEQANAAVASLNGMIGKINSGQGTVGKLLNDDKLYANLQSASKNLDKLVWDLKANPGRYLNFSVVHFDRKKKDSYPGIDTTGK